MRRRHSLAALMTAIAVFLGSVALAQAKPSVAILGLEVIDSGSGIDAQTSKLARSLTETLRDRAKKQAGPFVLAPNSNKDLLEMKLLSGCADESTGCMSKMGKQLGADYLMYGKVEKIKRGYQVTLVLLNIEKNSDKRETTDVIQFDDVNKSRINLWSRRLYNRVSGVPERGVLVVEANVDRGTVYVDGEIKGSLSGGKARISGLKTGRHEVQIEADGHNRYTADVTIKSGESETLNAELEPRAFDDPDGPTGPVDGGPKVGRGGLKIAAWSAGGLAVVSGALLTYQGMQVRKHEQDAETIARGLGLEGGGNLINVCDDATLGGLDDAVEGVTELKATCKKGDTAALRTNILIGVTAATAVAAVVLGYLAYSGGGTASTTERQQARRKSKDSLVEIDSAVTVTPDYVGGTVKIEF